VLLDRADSITVEEAGEVGEGVEFTVRKCDAIEVHQVKRQVGNANDWSLKALVSAGVIASAQKHASADRDYYFVSTVPSRMLDELSDRARRTRTPQDLVTHASSDELSKGFVYLTGKDVLGSAEAAWRTLRRTYVLWPDERDIEVYSKPVV
jgi:hypothetical protein